jgi:hypothetical protein
VEKELNQ